MLSFISNVFICRDHIDNRIWEPILSGLFSVKSFYLALEASNGDVHPLSAVWMSLVPPCVEVFCWLAAAGKISLVDILRTRATLR